ncbi:hypothetical protein TNCT_572931 [Trichonephila clavata]|uniref:Uncharacterized protein n=1 Tax=Trichonephila clavata TaxID=2740835 RepID=A0A8X6L4T8_TRICU|nr:hypothetical protein TNCT_572931 [Trichonephila clavata]
MLGVEEHPKCKTMTSSLFTTQRGRMWAIPPTVAIKKKSGRNSNYEKWLGKRLRTSSRSPKTENAKRNSNTEEGRVIPVLCSPSLLMPPRKTGSQQTSAYDFFPPYSSTCGSERTGEKKICKLWNEM